MVVVSATANFSGIHAKQSLFKLESRLVYYMFVQQCKKKHFHLETKSVFVKLQQKWKTLYGGLEALWQLMRTLTLTFHFIYKGMNYVKKIQRTVVGDHRLFAELKKNKHEAYPIYNTVLSTLLSYNTQIVFICYNTSYVSADRSPLC